MVLLWVVISKLRSSCWQFGILRIKRWLLFVFSPQTSSEDLSLYVLLHILYSDCCDQDLLQLLHINLINILQFLTSVLSFLLFLPVFFVNFHNCFSQMLILVDSVPFSMFLLYILGNPFGVEPPPVAKQSSSPAHWVPPRCPCMCTWPWYHL